ncbi:MAG: selenium metabolism-associated LysR family transcriptional regulator [Dehalococcoidia bacterium]
MNLEHLRTYVEIVKRGSFSEAAKHLALSQPAVTHQIQKLERDLGVHLLDRKEGGATMTAAGEEFHRFAQKVLSEEFQLSERLQGLTGEVDGKLELGASTVPGEYILPRLLGDFTRRYPAVEASVQIGGTDAIAEKLMQGECDLAFVGAVVEGRGVQRVKFLDDDIVLIVPTSHPFARRTGISLEELEAEKLITRETGSGTIRSVHQMLSQAGFDGRRWLHAPVFGSTQAIVSAVEARLGVAFVSAFAAQRSIECGLISAVRIDGVPLKRDLYITYLEKHLTSKLQQEFLSFALLWASRQGPSLETDSD